MLAWLSSSTAHTKLCRPFEAPARSPELRAETLSHGALVDRRWELREVNEKKVLAKVEEDMEAANVGGLRAHRHHSRGHAALLRTVGTTPPPGAGKEAMKASFLGSKKLEIDRNSLFV